MCPVCQARPQNENLITTIEQKSDENAYLSECDSFSKALCSFILGSTTYRQPPHLLDLEPAEERPSPSKDSLSPSSENLFSLEATLEHRAMLEFYCHFFFFFFFSNSSESQLERPGWWFYSIFNNLGQNPWERGVNSQDWVGNWMK